MTTDQPGLPRGAPLVPKRHIPLSRVSSVLAVPEQLPMQFHTPYKAEGWAFTVCVKRRR